MCKGFLCVIHFTVFLSGSKRANSTQNHTDPDPKLLQRQEVGFSASPGLPEEGGDVAVVDPLVAEPRPPPINPNFSPSQTRKI